MGAAATITLPATAGNTADAKRLQLTDVDGQSFTVALQTGLDSPAGRDQRWMMPIATAR
jgi:hypothetical protein